MSKEEIQAIVHQYIKDNLSLSMEVKEELDYSDLSKYIEVIVYLGEEKIIEETSGTILTK